MEGVSGFYVGSVEGLAVDAVDDGAEEGVRGEHKGSADAGTGPEGGGGVDAADGAAFAHDDASAEEADAGDDVGDDVEGAGIAAVEFVEADGNIDEEGGADTDEDVGAKAGGALADLAFVADEAAEEEGGEECDEAIEEGGEVEGGEAAHRPLFHVGKGSGYG